MKRILIFSGTTEGRRITEFLDGRNVKVYVSAATEYGKECTGEHENAEVFFGRMDQKQMAEMIKEKQIDLVIDATHPFAQLVTGEIRGPAKSPVCSICVACGRRWKQCRMKRIG